MADAAPVDFLRSVVMVAQLADSGHSTANTLAEDVEDTDLAVGSIPEALPGHGPYR